MLPEDQSDTTDLTAIADQSAAPETDLSSSDQAGATDQDQQDTSESEEQGSPAAADSAAGDQDTGEEPSRLDKVLGILGLGKKKPDDDKPDGKTEKQETDPKVAKEAKSVGDQPDAAAAEDVVPPEVADHPAYKKLAEQVQTLGVAAERLYALHNFMAENQIDPPDARQALNLTALAKTDPEKFYTEICKIQQDFGIALGKTLPPDLQGQVDNGEITEELAKELAQTRHREKIASNQAETATTQVQARDEVQARQHTENTIGRWFDQTSKKDLNLPMKVDAITGEFLRLKVAKGDPKDDRALIALLNEANKNVTARLAAVRPKTPTPKSPSVSTPARTQARPAEAPSRLSIVENILARKD